MKKDRYTPGQSIFRRLSGRAHAGRIGPRPSFFHRFGLQDPFAVVAPGGDRADRGQADQTGPFVWLSSAAYHEEVAAARYRMLRRTAERERSRAGERLERVGPVAAEVAPIRALIPAALPPMTTLSDPETPAEVAPSRPAQPRRVREARGTPRVRARRPLQPPAPLAEAPARRRADPMPARAPEAPRPARRALQRVEPAPLAARALSRMLAEIRGRDRRSVAAILEKVVAAGPELLGEGPAAGELVARVRGALDGLRPVARATMRAAQPGAAAPVGLRRTLESSPTMIAMERPDVLDAGAPEPEERAARVSSTVKPVGARGTARRSRPAARLPARLVQPAPDRAAGARVAPPRVPATARAAFRAIGAARATVPARGTGLRPASVGPIPRQAGARFQRVPDAAAARSLPPIAGPRARPLAGAAPTELGAAPSPEPVAPRAGAIDRALGRARAGRSSPEMAAPIAGAPTSFLAPSPVAEGWTAAVDAPPREADRPTARALARSARPRADRVAPAPMPHVLVEPAPAPAEGSARAPFTRSRPAVGRSVPAPSRATRRASAAPGRRVAPPARSAASAVVPLRSTGYAVDLLPSAPPVVRADRAFPGERSVRAPGAELSLGAFGPEAPADDAVPTASDLATRLAERGETPADPSRARGTTSARPTPLAGAVWVEPPSSETTEATGPRERARQGGLRSAAPARARAGAARAEARSGRPSPRPDTGVASTYVGGTGPASATEAGVRPLARRQRPAFTPPARRAADRGTATPRTDGLGRTLLRSSPVSHVLLSEAGAEASPQRPSVGSRPSAGPASDRRRSEPEVAAVRSRPARPVPASADRPSRAADRRPGPARRVTSDSESAAPVTAGEVGAVAHAALRATPAARLTDGARPRVLAAPVATTLATPADVAAEVEGAPLRSSAARPPRTLRASASRAARTARRVAPVPGERTSASAERAAVAPRALARPAEPSAEAARPRGTDRVAARADELEDPASGPVLRAVERAERPVSTRAVALAAPPTAFLDAEPAPVDARGVVTRERPGGRDRLLRPVSPRPAPVVDSPRAAPVERRASRRALGETPVAARLLSEAAEATALLPTERAAVRDRAVARLDERGRVTSSVDALGVLRATLDELRLLAPASTSPEPSALAPRSRGLRPVGASSAATATRARVRARRPEVGSLPDTVLPRSVASFDARTLLQGLGAAPSEPAGLADRRVAPGERATGPASRLFRAASAPAARGDRTAVGRAGVPGVEPVLVRPEAEVEPAVPARIRRRGMTAAVHAALRSERSALLGPTSRRVAEGSSRVLASPADATVEARVVQGADGRIQRVVARAADGTAVRVAPEALGPAPLRAPPTTWIEGRAGVPMAEGDSPSARAAGRATSLRGALRRRPRPVEVLPGVDRARVAAPVGLGPMTLADAPVDEAPTATAAPRGARRLESTLASVASPTGARPAAPGARAARARRAGAARTRADRAQRPVGPLGEATDPTLPTGDSASATGAPAPSWARRAVEPTTLRGEEPDRSQPRVRVAGGLMSALARAGDPAEVVRVVLERSAGLSAAANELPKEARTLVERIARTAAAQEAASQQVSNLPQFRTQTRRVLTPTSTSHRTASGHSGAGATTVQGVGASGMMKLAGKLMKLIHLAESERRKADAQRQVRMAEDTASARQDGGAGQSGGESVDDKTMNIKALRQDVLDSVLREVENMQWRREDPDGIV